MARQAVVRLGADSRGLQRDLLVANSKFKGFGRKVTGVLKSAGRVAFTGLAATGGFGMVAGMAAAAKSSVDLDKRLRQLAINADVPVSKVYELNDAINAAAISIGTSPSSLLAGAEKFVAHTGDFALATKMMGSIGTVAAVTGSEMADVSSIAAMLSQNLGVGADKMEHFLAILVRSGQLGSVEFKDMVSELPTALANVSRFGGSGEQNLKALAAGFQIVKRQAGTAAEAGTRFNALLLKIGTRRGKLNEMGVRTSDSSGAALPLQEVLQQIVAISQKADGQSILKKIFGEDKEPLLAIEALSKFSGEFDDMVTNLSDADAAMGRMKATFDASPAAAMEKSMAMISTTLQSAILPHMDKFVAAAQAASSFITKGFEALEQYGQWLDELRHDGRDRRNDYTSREQMTADMELSRRSKELFGQQLTPHQIQQGRMGKPMVKAESEWTPEEQMIHWQTGRSPAAAQMSPLELMGLKVENEVAVERHARANVQPWVDKKLGGVWGGSRAVQPPPTEIFGQQQKITVFVQVKDGNVVAAQENSKDYRRGSQ